jgi:hypothetical protein
VIAALAACQPVDSGTTDGGPGGTNVDTSQPLVASAAQASKSLAALQVSAGYSISGYVRTYFKTWDSQGNGCDTRDVVLQRQGKGVKTESDCKIVAGSWTSPYDNKVYTSPQKLQIDHLVPLGDAWRSGAKNWDSTKREQYANDLKDPLLIAVDTHDNEAKGDDDPSEWKPPNQAFWCTYGEEYVSVKYKFDLFVTADEKTALGDLLDAC